MEVWKVLNSEMKVKFRNERPESQGKCALRHLEVCFRHLAIQGVCTVSVFSESPCGLFPHSTFSDNFIKSAIIFGLNLMLHLFLVFSFCAF